MSQQINLKPNINNIYDTHLYACEPYLNAFCKCIYVKCISAILSDYTDCNNDS